MKFINLKTKASPSDVISMLSDNDRVNHNVIFDDRGGKPFMNVMKNLYIKDENGNFSEEMMSIYEREFKEEE